MSALNNEPVVLSPAYYYGKKKSKRVGRPPGGHSNLEGGVKRRGRRRKRRKQLFVHKKRRSSASVDNTPAGSPQVTQYFFMKLYVKGGMRCSMFNQHCFLPHTSFESVLKDCLPSLSLAHRAVERKKIWMRMTPWVKTPARSCRTTSRMIQNSPLGNLSPPRRPPPHLRHPDLHAGAANPAHPHFLMMRIALPHQRLHILKIITFWYLHSNVYREECSTRAGFKKLVFNSNWPSLKKNLYSQINPEIIFLIYCMPFHMEIWQGLTLKPAKCQIL